jgi:surface protein
MFKGNYALKKCPKFLNTQNVTTVNNMFTNCGELEEFPQIDTSNVTDFGSMFYNCNWQGEKIIPYNTSAATTMRSMFYQCTKVTRLDLSSFYTGNVTEFYDMFNGCRELIDIIGTIDVIKASSIYGMFINCRKLTNVTLKNIKTSLQLGSGTTYGTLLSNESLINTFKELWDLTGETSQTLTLSTTSKENIANIYVKLITPTQEQIDADPYINNKKPCVVCESTDEGAMTLTEYATSKNWAIA